VWATVLLVKLGEKRGETWKQFANARFARQKCKDSECGEEENERDKVTFINLREGFH